MRSFLPFALVFAGCTIPCTSSSPVLTTDGGAAPCVQATDCPAPSSTLLCASDMDQLRGCIACEANRCVQYQPVACP